MSQPVNTIQENMINKSNIIRVYKYRGFINHFDQFATITQYYETILMVRLYNIDI